MMTPLGGMDAAVSSQFITVGQVKAIVATGGPSAIKLRDRLAASGSYDRCMSLKPSEAEACSENVSQTRLPADQKPQICFGGEDAQLLASALTEAAQHRSGNTNIRYALPAGATIDAAQAAKVLQAAPEAKMFWAACDDNQSGACLTNDSHTPMDVLGIYHGHCTGIRVQTQPGTRAADPKE